MKITKTHISVICGTVTMLCGLLLYLAYGRMALGIIFLCVGLINLVTNLHGNKKS